MDAASAFVGPALKVPTLSVICSVVDPITGLYYERDPRYVTKKAERYHSIVASPRQAIDASAFTSHSFARMRSRIVRFSTVNRRV